MMLRPVLACLVAWTAFAPATASADLECGYLMGTRQTAIRLAQSGWRFQDVLNESLNQPYYRNLTPQESELVIRVVQEAYTSPPGSVSELVVGYCQAEIARKNAAQAGGATPAQPDSPTPTR